jgi:hypothetical protein
MACTYHLPGGTSVNESKGKPLVEASKVMLCPFDNPDKSCENSGSIFFVGQALYNLGSCSIELEKIRCRRPSFCKFCELVIFTETDFAAAVLTNICDIVKTMSNMAKVKWECISSTYFIFLMDCV